MKANVNERKKTKVGDIVKLCIKRLLYKFLYKISLFEVRKRLKAKYKSIVMQIDEIEKIL
jgi:hypothetical protein